MVGLCNGVFDGLHEGHQAFLAEAYACCEFLVVAVNNDEWVTGHKGPGRPLVSLHTRMEQIRQYLGHRTAVIPFNGNAEQLAEAIKPDVIFRGWDQIVIKGPIPVVRIDRHGEVSTSSLLKSEKP